MNSRKIILLAIIVVPFFAKDLQAGFFDNLKNKANAVANSAATMANNAKNKASNLASGVYNKAQQASQNAQHIVQGTQEKLQQASQKVQGVNTGMQQAKQFIQDAGKQIPVGRIAIPQR